MTKGGVILSDRGLALAESYQLPLQETLGTWDWALYDDQGTWTLWTQHHPPFVLDYQDASWRYLKQSVHQSQPDLVRAMGAPYAGKRVLDMTLGWGKDAYILTQRGMHVTGIEYHPAVYILVKQALTRWQDKLKPFDVIWGDSVSHQSCNPKDFDVVYFDPMFPVARKAKPQKAIQLLQCMTQNTNDLWRYHHTLCQQRPCRIVCKGPRHHIFSPAPDHCVGQQVHFSIWYPHGSMS